MDGENVIVYTGKGGNALRLFQREFPNNDNQY